MVFDAQAELARVHGAGAQRNLARPSRSDPRLRARAHHERARARDRLRWRRDAMCSQNRVRVVARLLPGGRRSTGFSSWSGLSHETNRHRPPPDPFVSLLPLAVVAHASSSDDGLTTPYCGGCHARPSHPGRDAPGVLQAPSAPRRGARRPHGHMGTRGGHRGAVLGRARGATPAPAWRAGEVAPRASHSSWKPHCVGGQVGLASARNRAPAMGDGAARRVRGPSPPGSGRDVDFPASPWGSGVRIAV